MENHLYNLELPKREVKTVLHKLVRINIPLILFSK